MKENVVSINQEKSKISLLRNKNLFHKGLEFVKNLKQFHILYSFDEELDKEELDLSKLTVLDIFYLA